MFCVCWLVLLCWFGRFVWFDFLIVGFWFLVGFDLLRLVWLCSVGWGVGLDACFCVGAWCLGNEGVDLLWFEWFTLGFMCYFGYDLMHPCYYFALLYLGWLRWFYGFV